MRARARLCLLIAMTAVVSSRAASAAPTEEQLDKARRLFREATELEARQDWKAASEKLTEAIAIKDTPGLRFHLAHALEEIGKLVRAEQEYENAAEMIRRGAVAPDVEELLGPALQSIRERVPSLTVRVPAVEGATLRVDGHRWSKEQWGSPQRLDPGEHSVVVDAPGKQPFQIAVLLTPGEHRALTADLLDARPPAVEERTAEKRAAPQADVDTGGIGAREIVFALELVVASGAIGFGIYNVFERQSAEDRVDRLNVELDELTAEGPGGVPTRSACLGTDLPPQCEELRGAIDDYERAGDLAVISFVGAGVATAGAVATLLLWPSGSGDGEAQVAVAPLPSGAFSSVRVSF